MEASTTSTPSSPRMRFVERMTPEEAFDASTALRLAWSGWTHVVRRRRDVDEHALAMWRDRSRRVKARALVAWARMTKFQRKRRKMLLERAAATRATALAGRSLRGWKTVTKSTRSTRRGTIQKYLMLRASKVLRAWRRAAADAVVERGGAKTTRGEGDEARVVEPPVVAPPVVEPPRKPREPRKRVSVRDMQSRLWTKSDPSKPMPVSNAVQEIEESIVVARTESTTTTTTTIESVQESEATSTSTVTAVAKAEATASPSPSPPSSSAPETERRRPDKQRVLVQRRKVKVQASGDGGPPLVREDVRVTSTKNTSQTKTEQRVVAPPRGRLVDAQTMTTKKSDDGDSPTTVERTTTTTTLDAASTSATSSLFSILIVVVVLLAVFGVVALASLLSGFSVALGGDHSSAAMLVRQHLSEAQRNVTILARASAMQRRELEACRTFGGGVADASQNAAITSAEAKVSDSAVQVADLEVKLAHAKAEVVAAQRAQKTAEDRFTRLGAGAMKKSELQESLDKMTTRATYCEHAASATMKIKLAKDEAVKRADNCELEASNTKSKLLRTKTHLIAAQRALTKSVDVANECRYQIGLPTYVPTYNPESSLLRTIADMFPAFRAFFSATALMMYVIGGYAYYLRRLVKGLRRERTTLVTELTKIRASDGGVETSSGDGVPDAEGQGESDGNVGKFSFDRKRSRSVSEISHTEPTHAKKTATGSDDAEDEDEEEKPIAAKPKAADADAAKKENGDQFDFDEFVAGGETNSESLMRKIQQGISGTDGGSESEGEVVEMPGKAVDDDDDDERAANRATTSEAFGSNSRAQSSGRKSPEDEITDEMARIRKLLEMEDEREKREEQAQLNALRRQADLARAT